MPGQKLRRRLRIAFVGCAARAQTHAKLVMRQPEHFEIVAGVNPRPERVEVIRRIPGNPGFRGFDSKEALWSADELADVTIMTMPDHYHYEPCRRALELDFRQSPVVGDRVVLTSLGQT